MTILFIVIYYSMENQENATTEELVDLIKRLKKLYNTVKQFRDGITGP